MKNLNEIENAQQLKQADEREILYSFSRNTHGGDERMFLMLLGKDSPVFTQREIEDLMRKYHGYNVKDWTDLKNGEYNSTCFYVISQKLPGMINTVAWSRFTIENKDGLFIAAPKSHFDLKGLKKNKLGFFNITITEVKDPIVFRYVRGGIQVLSKWGLEASDEILINPIEN